MRTVVRIIQFKQFIDQFLCFCLTVGMISFDCSLARHGRKLLGNHVRCALNLSVGNFRKNLLKQLLFITAVEIRRHTPYGIFAASEVFHLKTDGIAQIGLTYTAKGNYTYMRWTSSLGPLDNKLQALRERFI